MNYIKHALLSIFNLVKNLFIMATLNNGASGKGNPGHQHDGQKDYQNSNQRNPDNVRNATRDHRYKEHEETLTNDANFDEKGQPKVDMELDDKDQNAEQ